MKDTLFVTDRPTVHGFPANLLPTGVTQVLLDAGFRVIARMDDRRIWFELTGIDMNPGTPDRPDLGMTHWSISLEAGIFGMHLVRSVQTTNKVPYSGMVYSGRVAQDAKFMKGLLAHCVSPDSKVFLDEEVLCQQIEHELFDEGYNSEVFVNWLPTKQQVEVTVKCPGRELFRFILADSAEIRSQIVCQTLGLLQQWQPA